ncbi:MAG: hypothetical protein KAQ64_00970 [Candidatus Pacebacteria bacterium]|nr:hypothetical protein [Candidatus Paceibacterota bacterium]
MAKKCIRVVFNILNQINKKIFLFVFLAMIFSLFVSFQNTEKITVNAVLIPCTFPGCGGCPDKFRNHPVNGYAQKKNCHCNVGCHSSSCGCGAWFYIDWCGDGDNNNGEDCDGATSPPANPCFYEGYNGLFLCDRCDWQHTVVDAIDCSANIPWVSYDRNDCSWEAFCTPIDWCGDGIVNGVAAAGGEELYCDISPWGASDFSGQTCASKICNDIDPTNLIDGSSFSRNPACLAEMAAYGGNLICANTCRHIYTVPACDFPLDATGIALSDDGLHVFVTDSSLWSLQVFSIADPTTVLAIYYFNAEPLSVDVVGSIGAAGSYAYVGTKGEFSIININQIGGTPDLDAADAFGQPWPPKLNKDYLYDFKEEQVNLLALPSVAALGEINDVHIDGNYAYLAIGTEGAVGPSALQIIDISAPAASFSVGSFSHADTMTGVQSVDVSGNYAYVSYTDGNSGVGYFEYFNVTNKAAPMPIKLIDIGTTSSSIVVSGNYAYIDGFSTQSTINIATPGNPASVLAVDNINTGFETFTFDIFGDNAYASVEGVGLRAVDISVPEDVVLGETYVVSNDVVNEIMVDVVVDAVGHYAYAAAGEAGIRIIDLWAVCGDGVLNGLEVCDGLDLGGETCVTQGFAQGDLSCNPFCTAFDTSACVDCGTTDGICPVGCTNPPDLDCPSCEGVVCNTPGFCEIGTGVCKNVGGSAVCVYPDDPNVCNTPGFCQVEPGRCDKSDGSCRYSDDPGFCDSGDGDICTGDRCVSTDGGLSSNCVVGSDICSGIVPCERMVNNPATLWDDTESCEFCHGVMLLNQGMNFLMKIASLIAVLAIIITGFLFITSAGNPERKNKAKAALKWVIVGFLILSLSWLIVDFLLSAWGYLDPLGGEWNVICD